MEREALIRKVALKMDEISSSNDVIVSVGIADNNPLYTQIDSLLNESVNDVLLKAPIYRLSDFIKEDIDSTPIVSEIRGTSRETAMITVPSDFLRFVSIQDTGLFRPITELAIQGDDTDKRQHNIHLMAKSAKPVAVISTGIDSMLITIYSFERSSVYTITLTYIPRYSGDDISNEFIIDVASWVCAGKVFAIQGDIAKSQACDANAVAIMS